jgi:hypothetical protein
MVVPSGYESKYPYDPSGKMAGGAEDNDRDPDTISIIAGAMATPGPKLDERIERISALGVTHAIVPTFPPDQLADIGRTLNDTYADA